MRTGGTFLGIRVSALVEIGLFYAVALALGGWNGRFEDFNPHPAWFLIALTGAQYGTGEAVAAALVSTLFLRAGNLPGETLDTDLYGWIWVSARLPLGWFLLGALTGEIRRRHGRNEDRLAEASEKAVARAAELGSAVERMHRVKQGLETVIASQLNSAVTLYQAAKKVEHLEANRVLEGALGLARAVLSCEQLSLYLVDRDALMVNVTDGWPEVPESDFRYPAEHPLFLKVIVEQQTLCVARQGDEHFLVRQGLLAGPLIDPETGESLGMLKIEKMGFLALNLSTLESFKAVCGWISEAYAKARKHERTAGETMFDEKTQLFSQAFLERESAFLARLGRRMRFAVSLLRIDLVIDLSLTEKQRAEAAEALSKAVHEGLRTTDLAFATGNDGCSFMVILTATPLRNAPIAAAKLRQGFQERFAHTGAEMRMSWHSLYEPPETAPAGAEDLARLAEQVHQEAEAPVAVER